MPCRPVRARRPRSQRARDLRRVALIAILFAAAPAGAQSQLTVILTAATGSKASYILARLAALSEPFGTRLEVAGASARISLGKDR